MNYDKCEPGLRPVFIYRDSSAIVIVGDHWRVKCFVLSYIFSSPVSTDNTSPMIDSR